MIKFKDYFNSNIKVSHPFDYFTDDTLIDIASQYNVENEDEIFNSEDIDNIMEDYIKDAFSNDSLRFVEYDAPKLIGKSSSEKSNMNASEAAQAVVLFLTTFLQSQEVDRKGRINLEELVASFQEQKEELTTVLAPFIQVVEKEKKERKPREKKLKDENAPKRPTTGYMLYCQDVRAGIKEQNPGKKMTEISKILGATWKELSDEDKKPYTKKASKDKKRFDKEMKVYIRPKDEDLLEQKVNQKKSRKSSGGSDEKSKRKKKDKDAPKGAISSYLYFAMEKRSEVKESNPDMTGSEVSKELGRMWKEDFGEEEDRKKWVNLAKKDKKRYTQEKEKWDEENAQREQSNGEEKESAVKEKKKKSRVKENQDEENQDEENQDEGDETESHVSIVESVKASVVKPKRKLPSFIPQ
jgi:hypothetical protein